MKKLINFFERIYRETVDDEDFTFYEVDLTNLKVRMPSGVSDVLLAISDDNIFRLSYTYKDETFVKYFYDSDRRGFASQKIAYKYASQDAEIEDDPENHIGVVRHSRRSDGNGSPIPMYLNMDIIKTAKAQFPNGKCENKSEHVHTNNNKGKLWHNVVPDEIFDAWASRVIEKMPSNIDYISENVPNEQEKIIIPINLAYKGFCKELSEVGKFIRERLKRSGRIGNKKDYVVKPGLARVYSFVENEILTEFMFNLTPNKVVTWNPINTDDTKAVVWDINKFSKEQIEEMQKAFYAENDYWKGER